MNATEWVEYYKACETELFNRPQLTIPAWVAKYQKALEWYDDWHSADETNPYHEKGDEDRFRKWRLHLQNI